MSKTASHPDRSPLGRLVLLPALLMAASLVGCRGHESSRVIETQTVASHGTDYRGPRAAISIGKFSNASPYSRGIFSDGEDRLGGQARTILKTHLSQTGRFNLLDRENIAAARQEGFFNGEEIQVAGADVLISGQVTEFGRKTVGDKQLFGVLGRGKTQTAYSKVSLNIIAAAICALTACRQNRTYYNWGSYEQSVRQLSEPDIPVDVDGQIVILTQQIERTRQAEGRIPPGLHAHIGLLYSMRGDLDTAQAAVESEKELYPESTAFIDGVIERMGAKK